MSYNEKSRENLVPFRKREDDRRMRGRRKGSLNQTSMIKRMLSENIAPEMIFSPTTRDRFKNGELPTKRLILESIGSNAKLTDGEVSIEPHYWVTPIAEYVQGRREKARTGEQQRKKTAQIRLNLIPGAGRENGIHSAPSS